ncbi:MAG: hypothetical protein NT092_01630 [Bacteroidia bacterium]|nr:hypothetical protein [Bacteroidia bacterium]
MKKNNALSLICTILFLIGIVAAFFGFLNQGNMLLKYSLLIVSIVYLLSGWYIFKGYHPEGHPLLLFLMGYLYSSVFMSFAFAAAGWPLAKSLIAVAIAWAAIQIIMVTVIRKKLSREGFIQLLIEGCLMLVMAIAVLIYML